MNTIKGNPYMAALTTTQGAERSLANANVMQFAAMKSAFDGCSAEVQEVITDMINIILDPTIANDEKSHAIDVICEAMFPSLTADFRELDERFNALPEAKAEEAELIAEEEAFGERLKVIMEQRGMSQESLAGEAGVSQPAISNMLNRRCRPQKRTIARFAAALGVKPEDLWPNY